MKIIPIGNRVVLKPVEKKEKTNSGIYIPKSEKDDNNLGKVVAIGNEVTKVKEGDSVVFSQFAGTEVSYSEGKFIITEEKDILGLVKESE